MLWKRQTVNNKPIGLDILCYIQLTIYSLNIFELKMNSVPL